MERVIQENFEFMEYCLEALTPISDPLNCFIKPSELTGSGCKCKKSRCIKLYCECFSNGSYCRNCECKHCQNKPDKLPRNKAMRKILLKKPRAFEDVTGCRCNKSGCQKNYCDCYYKGLSCTQMCECVDCKNPNF